MLKEDKDVRSRRLVSILCYKVRGVPLYIIGICGLAGVLIDLDHPISYGITGKTSRFLHIPLAIVCCVFLCFAGAYCGRLYYKYFLRGKK